MIFPCQKRILQNKLKSHCWLQAVLPPCHCHLLTCWDLHGPELHLELGWTDSGAFGHEQEVLGPQGRVWGPGLHSLSPPSRLSLWILVVLLPGTAIPQTPSICNMLQL